MSDTKMQLWNEVQATDPSATKEATVSGQKITSISGQHMIRRATEMFGPVGIGWGWSVVEERFDQGGPDRNDKGEVLGNEVGHTVRIRLWFELNGKLGEDQVMSKRKPNNTRARVERASRALLSSNYVRVINIDPHGGQFLVHLKTGKPIHHGVALANAVCDIPHRWAVYFSAFCIDQNGLHYIKSSEIATPGIHLAGQLTEVIEEHYRALMDTCNRRHIVGSAWIANPCGVSLSEEQAAHIYDVTGAWQHVERTQAA